MKTHDPIHKVISAVLRANASPMLPEDIYQAIVEGDLYPFRAQDPLHVVKTQLRRHSKEWTLQSSRVMKYFSMMDDGRFELLERPVRVPPSLYEVNTHGGGKESTALVSIPNDDEDQVSSISASDAPTHSEIQWRLLDLGSQMGFTVWAPRGDRVKSWNGKAIGNVPRMLQKLPVRFVKPVAETIENIDVLWFNEQKAIVAGFEVEHTTTVYSGLLRMADLLTMQPNLEIKIYLTAPDRRLKKFAKEVIRPAFSALAKPLYSICRFLPYGRLLSRLGKAHGFVQHLKPEFLDDIAEVCNPLDEGDDG